MKQSGITLTCCEVSEDSISFGVMLDQRGGFVVHTACPADDTYATTYLTQEQAVELHNWLASELGEKLHTHTDAKGHKYRVTANDVCWWDGSGWLYMGHPSDVSTELTEVQRNG